MFQDGELNELDTPDAEAGFHHVDDEESAEDGVAAVVQIEPGRAEFELDAWGGALGLRAQRGRRQPRRDEDDDDYIFDVEDEDEDVDDEDEDFYDDDLDDEDDDEDDLDSFDEDDDQDE